MVAADGVSRTAFSQTKNKGKHGSKKTQIYKALNKAVTGTLSCPVLKACSLKC